MEKGKWFLYCEVEARGFNSVEESMGPTHLKRKIKVCLDNADNSIEAMDEAEWCWNHTQNFDSIPLEFRQGIKRDDDLNFFNPKIVYERVDFEKELVVLCLKRAIKIGSRKYYFLDPIFYCL